MSRHINNPAWHVSLVQENLEKIKTYVTDIEYCSKTSAEAGT